MAIGEEIMKCVKEFTEGCSCDNPKCRLNYTEVRTIAEQKQKWLWMHDEVANMSNLMLGHLFELHGNPGCQDREQREDWVDTYIEIVSCRMAAWQLVSRAMLVVPVSEEPAAYRSAIYKEVERYGEQCVSYEIDLTEVRKVPMQH